MSQWLATGIGRRSGGGSCAVGPVGPVASQRARIIVP